MVLIGFRCLYVGPATVSESPGGHMSDGGGADTTNRYCAYRLTTDVMVFGFIVFGESHASRLSDASFSVLRFLENTDRRVEYAVFG